MQDMLSSMKTAIDRRSFLKNGRCGLGNNPKKWQENYLHTAPNALLCSGRWACDGCSGWE